jgi:hypothetical protein
MTVEGNYYFQMEGDQYLTNVDIPGIFTINGPPKLDAGIYYYALSDQIASIYTNLPLEGILPTDNYNIKGNYFTIRDENSVILETNTPYSTILIGQKEYEPVTSIATPQKYFYYIVDATTGRFIDSNIPGIIGWVPNGVKLTENYYFVDGGGKFETNIPDISLSEATDMYYRITLQNGNYYVIDNNMIIKSSIPELIGINVSTMSVEMFYNGGYAVFDTYNMLVSYNKLIFPILDYYDGNHPNVYLYNMGKFYFLYDRSSRLILDTNIPVLIGKHYDESLIAYGGSKFYFVPISETQKYITNLNLNGINIPDYYYWVEISGDLIRVYDADYGVMTYTNVPSCKDLYNNNYYIMIKGDNIQY